MRSDSARLAQLHRLAILDTEPERVYDDITRLLTGSLEVPIAMINLLDVSRDWFKSVVGLPLTESPSRTSFCEIFFQLNQDWLVVEDTRLDPRFARHPLVTGEPFVRFYAAARLVAGGQTVGTLCAYDVKSRRLDAEQLDELRTLAGAAAALLNQRSPGLATDSAPA